MTSSPFKFLDSYSREDIDIFFGRESEIEEAYSKVLQEKILLVYGASGTGKSSLISCGLANKFDDTDWQPINIRRGTDINRSIVEQVGKIMVTPPTSPNASLSQMLTSAFLDHFKPIYIILDQFEELFIFGDRDEWMTLAHSIKEAVDSVDHVHFVIIIRGEYLEYLTDFQEILPGFFNNRQRVEKMIRSKAASCITGPCQAYGIEVEHNFPDNLLNKLSPNKSEIELTYLQVFLDRVFKSASEKSDGKKIVFSNQLLDEIGNIGDVLSHFLDEQISQVSDSEKALMLLKAFVSTDGTKRQLSLAQAGEFVKAIGQELDSPKIEALTQELVNRRILKEKDESGCYELRHDSIAFKIYEKITSYERNVIEVNQFITYAYAEHEKRNFLLNDSDLAYIAPYESKLNLPSTVRNFLDKSKTAVRRRNRSRKQFYVVLAVISILLVTSIFGLISANQQRTVALGQKLLAEQQSEKAEQQSEKAEQQTKVAQSERIEALRQKEIAEAARARALVLQQQAELSAKEIRAKNTAILQQMKRADSLRMIARLEGRRADSITSIKFDKIVPVVKGPTYLVAGAKYRGELYMAAASSVVTAEMFVDGKPINVDQDPRNGLQFGVVEFGVSLPRSAEVFETRTFEAAISLNDSLYQTTVEYAVVRPVIRVTSGNAPTLYLNCGNSVFFEVPALGSNFKPSFTSEGAKIIPGNSVGHVIVIPTQENVVVKIHNDGVLLGSERFEAKEIPQPSFTVDDKHGRRINFRMGSFITDIDTLTVRVRPEQNFANEVPKDAEFLIGEMEVTLARGTARIAQLEAKTGLIDLSELIKIGHPGDRLVIDVKSVKRKTFTGNVEEMNITSNDGIISIPISSR